MMFDPPKSDEFTQGTVFSCAYAENYRQDPVYGLVITARCDAAQDKVPVFSYVPVVALTTWVLVDGARIALERIGADCINTAKSLLKANLLSESLIRTHSLSSIYAAHFQALEEDRKKKNHCEKFQAAALNHVEALALMEDLSDRARLLAFLTKFSAVFDNVTKELSANRLTGYYLLPHLESLEDSSKSGQCYVALLREVHHIPTQVARSIAKGIAPPDEWTERRADAKCPFFRSRADLAMPIGKLKSPWIEHLMQNFSLLFSRIGIPDTDIESVRRSLRLIGLGE